MSDRQVRRDSRWSLLLAGGALAVAGLWLAGCAGSGFEYVSNPDLGVFFKVPEHWTVLEEDDLAAAEGRPRPAFQAVGRASLWLVLFDAAPSPSFEHFLNEDARYPVGVAQARLLSPEERDEFSLASLRNEILPLDEIAERAGDVQRLHNEDIELPNGVHGHRGVYVLPTRAGGSLTYDQTALVDATTHTVYVLAIGCGGDCYERHHDAIQNVVASWTIKEPRP